MAQKWAVMERERNFAKLSKYFWYFGNNDYICGGFGYESNRPGGFRGHNIGIFVMEEIKIDDVGNIICPRCGGHMVEDEPDGHESGGNFITPPMFEIDNYNYHCRDCGFEIQTKNEL